MGFEISISILCGGKSERFGSSKFLITVKDRPLIEIIYDKLKDFSDDVFLQGCGNAARFKRMKNYPDIVKDKGPLGGLYSALLNAKYDKLFAIACDVPFVDAHVLEELAEYKKYDVVVPQWRSGYYEPLCAIYSKNLILRINALLDKNILKITALYGCANVKTINIDELVEKGHLKKECFKNINCPEDLASLAL